MSKLSLAKIAVVEDDPGLRFDLVEFLSARGFDVTGVADAAGLYRLMAMNCPDLVLLDVRLPGESGLEVARRLRERDDIRLVMLTSQSSDQDRVEGLEAGVDAYLDKQTSLTVIEATCRSVLRRADQTHAAARRYPEQEASKVSEKKNQSVPAHWTLDTLAWLLTAPNGRTLKLTHTEHAFLASLLRQPGQPVGRPAILAQMGKTDTVVNRRNLDSCARRVRKKILVATGCELPLESSYGFGYVFQGHADCAGDNETDAGNDERQTNT